MEMMKIVNDAHKIRTFNYMKYIIAPNVVPVYSLFTLSHLLQSISASLTKQERTLLAFQTVNLVVSLVCDMRVGGGVISLYVD